MRYHPAFLLFCCLPLIAANESFNGRWDITVSQGREPRAWWLEVIGAETSAPSGKFVGAPGGQMDTIQGMAVNGGELRFSFDREPRGDEGAFHGVWTAKLVGDTLQGRFYRDGRLVSNWTGKRAPAIAEMDDGSWKKSKPVQLFNGKDLSGWKALAAGRKTGWIVKDGIMFNQGGAENLVSDGKFWNFELQTEFRLQKRSNSGIGLRGRYEVQIMEDYGRPINGHSSGTIYGRILPTVNASKQPGEWQTYDIRLVGREVTVVYNGIKVIDKKEIEGLTAIAMDPNEAEPGPIVIQGDHGPVEFRSIVLTPLVK